MPRGVSVYDEAVLQRRLWSPIALGPALTSWHDPSNVANLGMSGSSVKSDADLGPRGYTETSTSTNAPTLAIGAINGRTAERFNNGPRFESCAMLSGPAVRTFALVYLPTGSGATQTMYGASGNSGLQFRVESGGNLGMVSQYVVGIGNTSTSGPLVVVGTPALVVASYRQATGAYSFRLNGALIGSGASSQSLSSTTTSTVGYNASGNGEYATGFLGGRICIDSDAVRDIQRIEGRLAWDWGLPLAAGHPFAVRPPLVGD